jgi:hypothetical protein
VQANFKENVRQLHEYNVSLQTLVGSMIGRQSGPDRTIHSTPLYQLLDFDLHEIRVLLVAWDEEEDTPIICSMEHISLINPKPYIALS